MDDFKVFIEFVTISLLSWVFCFLFFVFGCEAHGIKPAPLALRAHFSTGKRASYFHDDAMRQCIVLKGIPHSRPS